MARLFGTDGIRGVAGEPPLDGQTVYRVGYCLTEYLKVTVPKPCILIARDTRASGPWLEAILKQAIDDAGGTPRVCGVLSTPAVSILTTRTKAQAGIMISASHNPYRDNGIKIFASNGIKFTDAVEGELEGRISSSLSTIPREFAAAELFSSEPVLKNIQKYSEIYEAHLLDSLPRDFRLDGMHLVVDCAHGSLSAVAPQLLRGLGAEVKALHCQPDGRNINLCGGALHLEKLREEVLATRADLGVAFDGDADRAMFVDSQGRCRDGDDALYLLTRYTNFLEAPRVVVGTVMANLGLELALANLGFRLVRTPVGDRYVLEEMLKQGAILGGEQSGHVIFLRLAQTGDGLLTALKVLEILRTQNTSIGELCRPINRFPQTLISVPVREKIPLEKIPGLREAEQASQEKLGLRSRILLRYSGTEKVARVMVEGEDEQTVQEVATNLSTFFERLS